MILQLALCGKVRRWPPTLAERVGVRGAGVTSHLSGLKRFCEAPTEERLVAGCEGVLWWRQEQAGGRRLLLMLITLSSHPLARQRCRVTSNRDISREELPRKLSHDFSRLVGVNCSDVMLKGGR